MLELRPSAIVLGFLTLTGVLAGCGSSDSQDAAASAGAPSSGGSSSSGGSGAVSGTGASGGSVSAGGSAGSGGSAGASSAGAGGGTFSGQTAAELLGGLGVGWNLGNSLDVPEGETAWGNPVVSQALLDAVADGGFGLVRIPVTWSLHTGAAPDYVIDEAWLTRVEEVVTYATQSGLYAIINLHHDGADAYAGVEWLSLNDADGAVTEANNTAVKERFVKVWTQIAARFQGFGEQLLFESMNEIHDGYADPDPAYYTIINDLNQTFVDTVRQSGGNNGERHLVVPGYNTNIDYTLAGFALPSDPTPDHLILSVHYYDPWDFAGAAVTNVWGQASPGSDSWGQEAHVVAQFDKLQATYVSQGVPMIIGEYGAVHQAGFEDYRRYYMEYVTKAAVDRGIVPVFWDNGSAESGPESFGLIDRETNTPLHPALLEAMIRAATSSYELADVALPTPD
jgi:endoglucanase